VTRRRGAQSRWFLLVLGGLILFVLPPVALGGEGIAPRGERIVVRVNLLGEISSPSAIPLLFRLDEGDMIPYVWVSDRRLVDPAGTPAGRVVAACRPSDLLSTGQADRFVCAARTVLMQPGRTYYWWVSYLSIDPDTLFPEIAWSTPLSFTLVAAPTYRLAPTLPSRPRFDGARSVKHTRLTQALYKTFRLLKVRPRLLAVACWTKGDFEAVMDSADIGPTWHGATVTTGFWLRFQPRWLHLSARVCSDIQGLIDSGRPNAHRARSVATALHEALHAYGIDEEDRANCYAVQLAPLLAASLGVPGPQRQYLAKLAVKAVRQRAPSGYWDPLRCRDGGLWDLLPAESNLA
jgi:hypothetical protein